MINEHKIAILSTGDEIIQGDILNSNSQEIARRLFNLGMNIGVHATAPDDKTGITALINYLLKEHDALIITGGLGPTSDDVTRYALADAVGRPLSFHQLTWENIQARLAKLGYHKTPENNRQQAMFPEGANIIPNENGTAAGCYLKHHEKFIFMLPGPPNECMPMLDVAIDVLQKAVFYQQLYRDHWFLFSVSEGQIAQELDALLPGHDSFIGYRLCYPYLEVKLYSRDEKDFLLLQKEIEEKVSSHLLGNGKQFISEVLKEKILHGAFSLVICDHATGGVFESVIKTPKTFPYLIFASDSSVFDDHIPIVEIKGLEEYWLGNNVIETTLSCTLSYHSSTVIKKQVIPFRGSRVKQYAVEWLSYQILQLVLH